MILRALLAGDVFYRNGERHAPMIGPYNPARVVPAGQGFEWAFTWRNDTDETVVSGLASTEERCNLALAFTPFSMTAACDGLETCDGVLWDG